MLCFLHIPKTAGTAFRNALIRMVGADDIYWIGTSDHPTKNWRESTAADLVRYRVVGGHTNSRALRERCPHATFAVLLRDPVQRAISFYQFVKSVSKGQRNAPLRRRLQSLDLLSAIDSVPQFRRRISNVQCCAIAGTPSFEAARRTIDEGDWMIEATANIDRLLQRISQKFGWPQVQAERQNVSAEGYYKRVYTESVAEAIRNLNREDIQLFDKYAPLATSP